MNKIVCIEEIVPMIQEQIAKGGKVKFTPKGNSMLPLFCNNRDIVTLSKPQFPLKKYSIVFYQRNNGQYILHRLVGVDGGKYIMRGDNQYRNEYGISEEQIIAIVSEFERNGKTYCVTDIRYRMYCVIWNHTRHMRKIYRVLRRIAGKFKRKIKGK